MRRTRRTGSTSARARSPRFGEDARDCRLADTARAREQECVVTGGPSRARARARGRRVPVRPARKSGADAIYALMLDTTWRDSQWTIDCSKRGKRGGRNARFPCMRPPRLVSSAPRRKAYGCDRSERRGEVSEWLKEHAWKVCKRVKPLRGFESRSLRQFCDNYRASYTRDAQSTVAPSVPSRR